MSRGSDVSSLLYKDQGGPFGSTVLAGGGDGRSVRAARAARRRRGFALARRRRSVARRPVALVRASAAGRSWVTWGGAGFSLTKTAALHATRLLVIDQLSSFASKAAAPR
jgi:hypothetical protein